MQFDAIIVGGSYAGLSAALHLARGRRQVCVIDAGSPRNRFAHTSHGFLGRDGANPAAILEEARAQVLKYPTVTAISEMAVAAEPDGDGFNVTLQSGASVASQKLLLATGIQDVLPELTGVADRWGQTVIHCPYCHGYEFGGQNLGVLWTIHASIHQALIIPDWGPTTYFLNGSPLPDESQLSQLRQRGVHLETEPVVSLEGDAPQLTGVGLADGRVVAIDALLIAPPIKISGLIDQLGCEVDEGMTGQFVRTNEFNETTVPGVFAAGDLAAPYGNIALATASGVFAAASIHRSLMFDGLE